MFLPMKVLKSSRCCKLRQYTGFLGSAIYNGEQQVPISIRLFIGNASYATSTNKTHSPTAADDEAYNYICGPPLVRSPFDNPLRRLKPRQDPAAVLAGNVSEEIKRMAKEKRVKIQAEEAKKAEGLKAMKEFRDITTMQALKKFYRQVRQAFNSMRTTLRALATLPPLPANASKSRQEDFLATYGSEELAKLNMATASSSASGGGASGGGLVDVGGEQEKKREDQKRSTEWGLKIGFCVLIAMFLSMGVFVVVVYGPEPIGGDQYSDRNSLVAMCCRLRDALFSLRNFMKEPIREKLLPDPVKPPWHQPKYTVVIEMRDVLVKPQWDFTKGHYYVKRPALEYFMEVAGYPNFELVIYTTETTMQAGPVIPKLDPGGNRINHALFRECTRTNFGRMPGTITVLKDLNRLNRDLSKVIYIDCDPQASQNPENLLRLPKWKGDMEDTSLIDLAELLKTIHIADVDDVRPILQFYSSFDNPMAEFRTRAQQVAQERNLAGFGDGFDQEQHSLMDKYRASAFNAFGWRRQSRV